MARGLVWTALWLTYSTFFVGAATNATAPNVDLGYAQYQGYFDTQTNITNFLGVRYAAPPVGEYSMRLLYWCPPSCGRTDLHNSLPRKLEVSSTSAAEP